VPFFEVDQTSDSNISEVKKCIEMPVFKVNHHLESKISETPENISEIICNISRDFPTQVFITLSEFCENEPDKAELHQAIVVAEEILVDQGHTALTNLFSCGTIPKLDDLN
jgi:hypothetical protein